MGRNAHPGSRPWKGGRSTPFQNIIGHQITCREVADGRNNKRRPSCCSPGKLIGSPFSIHVPSSMWCCGTSCSTTQREDIQVALSALFNALELSIKAFQASLIFVFWVLNSQWREVPNVYYLPENSVRAWNRAHCTCPLGCTWPISTGWWLTQLFAYV